MVTKVLTFTFESLLGFPFWAAGSKQVNGVYVGTVGRIVHVSQISEQGTAM